MKYLMLALALAGCSQTHTDPPPKQPTPIIQAFIFAVGDEVPQWLMRTELIEGVLDGFCPKLKFEIPVVAVHRGSLWYIEGIGDTVVNPFNMSMLNTNARGCSFNGMGNMWNSLGGRNDH